jgi:hypothetical protein
MSSRSSVRPAVLVGLALAGVLMGHALTYRALVPDAHARAAELAGTGHAYLSGANAIGLVAAVVALSVLFLGRLVRAEGDAPHAFVRVAAFQLVTFVAMELLERIGGGAGLRGLLSALLVGVPVQVLVAGVVALIVRWILRAAAIVAERNVRGAAPWPVWAVGPAAGQVAVPALAPVTGPAQGRAPPFVP